MPSKYVIIHVEPHESANIFEPFFFFELATDLLKKFPISSNKLSGCSTEDYYSEICNKSNKKGFQIFNLSKYAIKEILSYFHTNNAASNESNSCKI